jgi:hypothetical protein
MKLVLLTKRHQNAELSVNPKDEIRLFLAPEIEFLCPSMVTVILAKLCALTLGYILGYLARRSWLEFRRSWKGREQMDETLLQEERERKETSELK